MKMKVSVDEVRACLGGRNKGLRVCVEERGEGGRSGVAAEVGAVDADEGS